MAHHSPGDLLGVCLTQGPSAGMENLFSSPELRASLGRLFVSYANSTWEGSRAAGTKGKEMPVLPWLGSWRRACWGLMLEKLEGTQESDAERSSLWGQ